MKTTNIISISLRLSLALVASGFALAAAPAAPKAAAVKSDDRLGELITIPAGKFLMGNNGKEKLLTSDMVKPDKHFVGFGVP